jgi:ABC-type multidrug transport system fused ATPase/permease subunit
MGVAVRQVSDLESNIVSVERLTEYSQLAAEQGGGECPPPGWPHAGHVRFDHYSTRYRDGLPLALDDVHVEFGPAEKVKWKCNNQAPKICRNSNKMVTFMSN